MLFLATVVHDDDTKCVGVCGRSAAVRVGAILTQEKHGSGIGGKRHSLSLQRLRDGIANTPNGLGADVIASISYSQFGFRLEDITAKLSLPCSRCAMGSQPRGDKTCTSPLGHLERHRV